MTETNAAAEAAYAFCKQPSGPFIKTSSGVKHYFLHPDPSTILLRDVVRSLANTKRWNGYIDITTAQHVLEVGDLMRIVVASDGGSQREQDEAQLVGHVHDFSESIMGDAAGPLKRVDGLELFNQIEEAWHSAMYERFGLMEARAKYRKLCKEADTHCLYADAVRFGMDGVRYDQKLGCIVPAEREWVPADFETHLPKAVMPMTQAGLVLQHTFASLMHRTDRGHLL